MHSLIMLPNLMQAKKYGIFFTNCVYVNTVFSSAPVTVASGDKASHEFDRRAGAEVAQKERLVAGSSGHKTPITRLEYKPGFAGQPGIAAAQGAGLRNALSGARLGPPAGRSVPQKSAFGQNRLAISIGTKAGDFSNQSRAIAVGERIFMSLPFVLLHWNHFWY